MFLGHRPKRRVRTYKKPLPLREAPHFGKWYAAFGAWSVSSLLGSTGRRPSRAVVTCLNSHPRIPGVLFVCVNGEILRRKYVTDTNVRVTRFRSSQLLRLETRLRGPAALSSSSSVVNFYSVAFREPDARVFVVGSSDGAVHLFGSEDIKRGPLKTLRYHTLDGSSSRGGGGGRAVRICGFVKSELVFSGGDDGCVRVENLLRGGGAGSFGRMRDDSIVLRDETFGDFVRAGCVLDGLGGGGSEVFAAGSYSRLVRVYDVRQGSESVLSWSEGGPVESMTTFRSPLDSIDMHEPRDAGARSQWIVLAERNFVRVYDIRMSTTPVMSEQMQVDEPSGQEEQQEQEGEGESIGPTTTTTPSPQANFESSLMCAGGLHKKAISDVVVYTDAETDTAYLLTASLDATFAISELRGSGKAPQTLRRFRFQEQDSSPLSFARHVVGLKGSSDRLVVATLGTNLLTSVSQQRTTLVGIRDEKSLVEANCRSLVSLRLLKDLTRLKRKVALGGDSSDGMLGRFADGIAKFRYKEVLLESIREKGRSEPVVVVSIIEELRARNELINALDAREPGQLCEILEFVGRYITDERFCRSLGHVFGLVMHFYGCVLGRSEEVDRRFRRIQRKMKRQIAAFEEMQKLKGLIDLLMVNALQ